ncbi:MAG: hypothetical protein ACI9UR_002467 [Bacteroidia bacterium]|jgi:hypothetical protein
MKKVIEIIGRVSAVLALVTLIGSTSFGQSMEEFQAQLDKKIADKTIPGATLGMVMCEDATGNMVACSGNIEESVVGIVTNVPYVTLNKPVSRNASKFIFDSFVSADKGSILKGDYLVAGTNGNFVKTESANLAYAIALANVESGQQTIKVKVLNK